MAKIRASFYAIAVALMAAACLAGYAAFVQIRPVALVGDSIISQGDWSSLAPYVRSYGISGAETKRILSERAPFMTKVLIVEGGINDLANYWDDQIIPNYRKIIASAPPFATVYLVGIPPVDGSLVQPSWQDVANNEKIDAMNERIFALCPPCIPIRITLPAGSHIADGIHLNAHGYATMREAIRAALY